MRKSIMVGVAVAGVALVAGISLQAFADGGWYEHGENRSFSRYFQRADMMPADNPEYVTECGSCHMAYSPGMMPSTSWSRIMNRLEDHFGDNAELEPDVAARISLYLDRYAADHVSSGRSPGIARSLHGQAPLRFTETRYFRYKHHEIPPRLVQNNPDIGSFSRCDACHSGAEKGNYDEHGVRIPGAGRWDD